MDPTTAALAKGSVKELCRRFVGLAARNDEQLARDRLELALDWGAELKAALPEVFQYLDERADDLESKLATVLEDRQFGRIYLNFGFEAAREAIDERRRMLAHAAAGILDPDLPVERKARVERTLRELDPVDVRTLYGVAATVGGAGMHGAGVQRCGLLFSVPSGDVLVASGCIRLETSGSGFGGGGGGTSALVTQLGHDLLAALRSYLRSRGAPFAIPGREPASGDRPEEEARGLLASFPDMHAFLRFAARREKRIRGTYYSSRKPPHPEPLLQFFVHDWNNEIASVVDELVRQTTGSELAVKVATQPYTPEVGVPYDLHRVEISGSHDVLRHVADDCEAVWL